MTLARLHAEALRLLSSARLSLTSAQSLARSARASLRPELVRGAR